VSVRRAAIRAVASALYHTRLLPPLAAAAGYARRTAAFPVLVFHRVNDDQDPFFPSLPTSVFADRIAHIARHYRVLTVEDLADRMEQGTVPGDAIALTFDDGYRDNLTHAAPILAHHGLPATIFLVTGHIGTPDIPWFDRLALAFKTATRPAVSLDPAHPFPLTTPGDRLQALAAALAELKRLPDEERRRQLTRLEAELRPAGPERPKRLMLTWDEVGALRDLGFSIGAHTVSHPILSRTTPERAWHEIHGSKRAIEQVLGDRVRAFAYPNGAAEDYDETTTQLVRQAGFTCAVTTRRGLNRAGTSPFELRRGGPWEEHLPTFALKLACYRLAGT
jgi:peptidoglycan/xylan/chitin deacetylase (PgdA/CDA1 family)